MIAQPEVDRNDITVLGHSEGAIVAPRIALENKEVKKIVLMSATAENLRDLLEFQLITRPLLYADQIMDTNHDGLLSIKEVEAIMATPGENIAPLPSAGLVEKNNTTDQYQWHSVITSDQTGNISIEGDLKPLIVKQSQILLSNETFPGSIWLQSYFALNNTTEIIGNVSASILILQGENDTQVPVQQARLLEQKLTGGQPPRPYPDRLSRAGAHLLSIKELDSTPGADRRECAGGSAFMADEPGEENEGYGLLMGAPMPQAREAR